MFKAQPHKDELLPRWGYADRETADEGGESIHQRYREYRTREKTMKP